MKVWFLYTYCWKQLSRGSVPDVQVGFDILTVRSHFSSKLVLRIFEGRPMIPNVWRELFDAGR